MKKKLVFALVVIALLLVGCGPTDADCEMAWYQLDVEPGDEGTIVNIILNSNWAPDSIGSAVKECIKSGWDGYR